MKSTEYKKGFSLIELIVVITIIAVVSVVSVVSFSGANVKSRDSRRMSDLEKIRMALEVVRQTGTTYPAASGGLPVGLAPTYMPVLPTDPKSGSYYYVPANSNYTYSLYADMENLGSTNIAPVAGCGSNCDYLVTNP